MTLPNTSGPEWAAAQATPWLTVNEAMRFLDAFSTRCVVQDRDLSAPPGSCADGACYLVAAGATGAWAGTDGGVAIAVGVNAASGWLFVEAALIQRVGNEVYVVDEAVTLSWSASGWGASTYARVDLTGIQDGYLLRWDASNGIFYGASA